MIKVTVPWFSYSNNAGTKELTLSFSGVVESLRDSYRRSKDSYRKIGYQWELVSSYVDDLLD